MKEKVYSVNQILYLLLLIASILVIISSVHIPTTSPWFTIVSGVGCGGFASVVVAWLIDLATCRRNNEKAEKDQKEIFYDLIQHFETGIQVFIFQCEEISKDSGKELREQTWVEWISEAQETCGPGSDDWEVFVNSFLVFERGLAEEVKAIGLQKTQLINLGLISNNDSRIISCIGTWCSLVESTCSESKEELNDKVSLYVRILSLYLDQSDLLKHINQQKYKSIIE